MPPEQAFTLTCPSCRACLSFRDRDTLVCLVEGTAYPRLNGIWRLLAPGREAEFARFIREYETIRKAEGRGSDAPAYYRNLPYGGWQGWSIRARSYETLVGKVFPLIERKGRALRVLDIGAGSGWLAYRLAKRGHQAAAVDLLINDWDGLGAHAHFDADFLPIQADFDALPLPDGQADLLIFNASLHYSTDILKTLHEACRTLETGGWLVVLDTPVYHDGASGARMVIERHEVFRKLVGFPSDALPSVNYLTHEQIRQLSYKLDMPLELLWTAPGWRRILRRGRAWLRGGREPAQFPLITGQKL
jgi:SAM-dependent methyltransferase